jgi:hypothetical protein
MSNTYYVADNKDVLTALAEDEQQVAHPVSLPASPARGAASGGDSRQAHTTDLRRALRGFVMPLMPPVEKKPRSEGMTKVLEDALNRRVVRTVGGVTRDELDKRKVTGSNSRYKNLTTWNNTFEHYKRDGDAIGAMKVTGYDAPEDDELVRDVYEALAYTGTYIGTSGTLHGMLYRYNEAIADTPVLSWRVAQCVAWAESVLKFKPPELDFRGKTLKEVFKEAPYKVNLKGDAGSPYFKKVGDTGVLTTVFNVAGELLLAVSEGKLSDYAALRKARFLVCMKNKADFYEIAKLDVKTRAIYVYPAHWRLLFSAVQAQIKPLSFLQGGSSALGFSWAHGGGDALYEWVATRHKAGAGLYFAIYGDDQLWVFVDKDLNTYVMAPDYSHMDISLGVDCGKVSCRVWEKALHGKLDNTWRSILRLNCKMAFEKLVIVDGSNTFSFEHGLGSGISGTTKFDEIGSAVVAGWLRERWMEWLDDDSDRKSYVRDFVNKHVPMIRSIFGLTVKATTLEVHNFLPDEPDYKFPFLGYTLTRVGGRERQHYVPKPDFNRLVLCACTHRKKFHGSGDRMNAQMQKLRSLAAMGGYLQPVIFRALRNAYTGCLSRHGRPATDEEDLLGFSPAEVLDYPMGLIEFPDTSFPTYNWCVNVWLPPDDMKDPGVDGDFSSITSPETESVHDLTGAMLSTLNLDSWDEFEDDDIPMVHDRGDVSIPDTPSVAAKYLGKVHPLPQAQKDAYNAERRRKFLEAKQRFQAFVQDKRTKGRKKLSSKAAQYQQRFDFDYDPDQEYETGQLDDIDQLIEEAELENAPWADDVDYDDDAYLAIGPSF